MTPSTSTPSAELTEGLERLCTQGAFHVTENQSGNLFYWYRLSEPEALTAAAKLLAGAGARLCTISAYDPKREHEHPRHEIAYHFDCGGTVVSVTIALAEDNLRVPSISPLFRNADWNEREFKEMYAIEVVGLPNAKRLFLDEKLDAGIMNRIIPVSVLMNGASSKDLWERILAMRADEEAQS